MKKTKIGLHSALLSKKNLFRDFVILSITIFCAILLVGSNFFVFSLERKKTKKQMPKPIPTATPIPEEEIYQEVKALQETIDTGQWKLYRNQWYGIALKYPTDWQLPTTEKKIPTDQWIARYRFQKSAAPEQTNPSVFFLSIYETAKTKSLFAINEFPQLKEKQIKSLAECQNIQGHIIETGDYPAEEIYIGPEDDCYQPALFFSFTQGSYFFVLSAQTNNNSSSENDPRIELTNSFPDFFSIASTLENIDIVRPKPAPPKPKITAPMPVSYKKDSAGRLVCAKKNDKPGKSDQHKNKHMDMECCLDPDEYPNPHCSYNSGKYGKYL